MKTLAFIAFFIAFQYLMNRYMKWVMKPVFPRQQRYYKYHGFEVVLKERENDHG